MFITSIKTTSKLVNQDKSDFHCRNCDHVDKHSGKHGRADINIPQRRKIAKLSLPEGDVVNFGIDGKKQQSCIEELSSKSLYDSGS